MVRLKSVSDGGFFHVERAERRCEQWRERCRAENVAIERIVSKSTIVNDARDRRQPTMRTRAKTARRRRQKPPPIGRAKTAPRTTRATPQLPWHAPNWFGATDRTTPMPTTMQGIRPCAAASQPNTHNKQRFFIFSTILSPKIEQICRNKSSKE
jgi:hypothetical protein